MNFLPSFRLVACSALTVTLCACATPANRRELYNTSAANGAWHDYAQEHAPDVPPGKTVTLESTTTTTRTRLHGGTPLSPATVPSPDAAVPPPPAAAPVAPAPAAVPPPPAIPEAAPTATAPAPAAEAGGAAIPGVAAPAATPDTSAPAAATPPPQ